MKLIIKKWNSDKEYTKIEKVLEKANVVFWASAEQGYWLVDDEKKAKQALDTIIN